MSNLTYGTSAAQKAKIKALREAGKTWRQIAANDYHGTVKPGTLCRFVKTDWEPRRPTIRAALGLPALVPAPCCRKCGAVHVTRRCTAPPPALDYDAWKRANAGKLAEYVTWAEGHATL